jgi:hypothetical protein
MSRERLGRRGLEELRDELSGRDIAIVVTVADYKLLSARQVEALFFPAHEHATALTAARCCRRVLERLTHGRLLVRLERRIGGLRAGSASFVYGLGPVGQRLIEADGPRRRFREPSATFVDHTLAVSQLVVDITALSRAGGWELLQIQGEPRCWRSYGGVGGREVLRPDLFLVLGVGDYEHRWFVEVDRGTETLPSLLRKCRSYAAYYASGREQATHEVFPRVLWIVPTTARAARLERALAADRRLPAGLFIVTTDDAALTVLEAGQS